MDYEPPLTTAELEALGTILGSAVVSERRIFGGQSATTDVVVDTGGQRFAVRRHGRWSIGFDDGVAAREQAVLLTAAAAGVPVPNVMWSGQLGATTATVTEFVAGLPVITPHDPMLWATQLATTLAAIHAVAVSPSLAEALRSAPPPPVDLKPAAGLLAHRYGAALLNKRIDLSPASSVAPQLVHGDYWPGNLLWRQGEIVAVLDWEAATLGDPASDIAYCFAEMRYFGLDDAADRLVSVYRDVTGAGLQDLDYWMVTALCRAVPELDSYLAGWKPLGYAPDPETVRDRLNRLIAEALAK